jgi:hypothetical protein
MVKMSGRRRLEVISVDLVSKPTIPKHSRNLILFLTGLRSGDAQELKVLVQPFLGMTNF